MTHETFQEVGTVLTFWVFAPYIITGILAVPFLVGVFIYEAVKLYVFGQKPQE